MQETPAPKDYVYTKGNRLTPNDEERKEIESKYLDLSMASTVSSLLYVALNTQCDILWIVNKLAKLSSNPGLEQDFKALMHCFGYLRKYPDYAIKFYANIKDSPVYEICEKHNVSSYE